LGRHERHAEPSTGAYQRRAQLTGWTLQQALGISADGNTIVGDGIDPNGLTEGWIATIPEPTTDLLVMAGVLGLAMARRRRA
jgi:hypothetical protein